MNTKSVVIDELMESSGVKFGTSGARGLVADMTDEVCYAYTRAFLQHLQTVGDISGGAAVAIAGDLRPSSGRIMQAVAAAVEDAGFATINCGRVPSPTVAFFGISRRIPSIMVTGSHIPDDRNGIKFNKSDGEILKEDEQAIRAERVTLPAGRFNTDGALAAPSPLPTEDQGAYRLFIERYRRFFGSEALRGLHVGLYEHSSVARDILHEILSGLGAQVTRLARSETFIPVDTEAVRPEDRELAAGWAGEQSFDAIVSTDGDGDRPLISDEGGNWLRGDVAGVLCARFLGARFVATPVSSNTAVEKSGWFDLVARTRIGSPFVIAAMEQALAEQRDGVVGYEANGGFLIASPIVRGAVQLDPLPTRDAVIVIVSLLALAQEKGQSISELVHDLPPRFTGSDRVKAFPTELSGTKLQGLLTQASDGRYPALEAEFRGELGPIHDVDTTDGVRITFDSGEIVHLRPSGNAPELRCYTEADSQQRTDALVAYAMKKLESWNENGA